jgi:hypothetical protein
VNGLFLYEPLTREALREKLMIPATHVAAHYCSGVQSNGEPHGSPPFSTKSMIAERYGSRISRILGVVNDLRRGLVALVTWGCYRSTTGVSTTQEPP